MEVTQSALEQGMGQYAILREAPVTRALDQLRDELQALREEAASGQKSAGAGGNNEDKSAIAMQQALNQAEKVRREIEQLGRNGQNGQGNQQGSQQGQKPGQGNQQGNQPGQQAGNQQGGNQQGQGRQGGQQQASGAQQGQGQQGGQQSGGQQSGGQQGSQGGQQGGQQSASGGSMSQGGGYGTNAGNRGGAYGGAWDGRNGPWNNGPDSGAAWDGKNVDPQQAYNDVMRDIGRLRAMAGPAADDKDIARQLQDLQKRAQDLDPKHWTNQGQLDSVVGAQVLSEVDQLELVLRRKLQATDGSVRSANPRNTPPGYADAVAEYYKRLSKQ
jgi:hypothetical protein